MTEVSFSTIFTTLFVLGAFGAFLNRRNFIVILLSIEAMLLSVNLNFITASTYLNDLTGQLFALWIITAAAAETAIGLALCVQYIRLRQTLDVEYLTLLKG